MQRGTSSGLSPERGVAPAEELGVGVQRPPVVALMDLGFCGVPPTTKEEKKAPELKCFPKLSHLVLREPSIVQLLVNR